MHTVFGHFLQDVFSLFDETIRTPDAMAARISASKLCYEMGDSFTSEDSRSKSFDDCISGLLPLSINQHTLKPQSDLRYGIVDRAILAEGVVIAIREDKIEPGSGESDVYMQIVRDYDLSVKMLREKDTKVAKRFLAHGAPTFLICVLGSPRFFVTKIATNNYFQRTHFICMRWILRWRKSHCGATRSTSFHAP